MSWLANLWSQGPKQVGYTQNFDPGQKGIWDSFTNKMPAAYDMSQNPLYGSLLEQIQGQLNPYGSEGFNKQFQEGFVNPAMKTYQEDVLPQIRSQFYSPTASYGAGLNQAINKSAENLQSGLGELRAKYGMSQQQAGIVNALGMTNQQMGAQQNYYNTAFGASPTSAMVQGPQAGPLKDIMNMIIQLLAGRFGGK